MSKNVVIVGGHSRVGLRLAKLLTPKHSVTSIIRNPSQAEDITKVSAKPLILDLETDTVSAFTAAFQDTSADVVVWSVGSGARGEDPLVKKVDYDGMIKIYDAIEGVRGEKKPRLVVVSALDIRDPSKIPAHYNEEDIATSNLWRSFLPAYMRLKYEADKELLKRGKFKWTILRAGALSDAPGTGKAAIGRTHVSPTISRDDVAKVLALLVDREDAAGLAIDLAGGETPIEDGLDAMIKRGITDFEG